MSSKFALAKKYEGLERNVWVEFIELALQYKPLNLGQGLPDDLVPSAVLNELSSVALDKTFITQYHQYTRGFGHPRLVSAIGTYYSLLHKRKIDSLSEVLITIGAYEGLYTAISGFVNPGDEVIIIEPFFDCYEPMVKQVGGIPKFISLTPTKTEGEVHSSDWTLNYDELRKLFSHKTKAIIFNNPNNPLGKVFSEDEMKKIADLCIEFDTLCISDEVYEHMIFDGHKMLRMASLPGMWERTVSIGSAGKTFSVTGWKLGWVYGPQNLIRNCQIAHQNTIYTCTTPVQEVVARGFELEISRLSSPDCYFNSISRNLEKKRNYIASVLRDVGMTPVIPQGGYFILANWTSLTPDLSSETDERADYRFVKWLTKNKGLQGIPPSAFFSEPHKSTGESYIRFCFIKSDESLEKAKDILNKLKNEI